MRTELSGSRRFRFADRSDRVPVGVDQHFASTDVVGSADLPVFLHSFDQPGCAIVADPKLALEVRSRRLLAFRYDLDRFAIELSLGIFLASRLAVEQIAAIL